MKTHARKIKTYFNHPSSSQSHNGEMLYFHLCSSSVWACGNANVRLFLWRWMWILTDKIPSLSGPHTKAKHRLKPFSHFGLEKGFTPSAHTCSYSSSAATGIWWILMVIPRRHHHINCNKVATADRISSWCSCCISNVYLIHRHQSCPPMFLYLHHVCFFLLEDEEEQNSKGTRA